MTKAVAIREVVTIERTRLYSGYDELWAYDDVMNLLQVNPLRELFPSKENTEVCPC